MLSLAIYFSFLTSLEKFIFLKTFSVVFSNEFGKDLTNTHLTSWDRFVKFRERKYVRSRLNALTKDAAQITDSRGDQPGDCGETCPPQFLHPTLRHYYWPRRNYDTGTNRVNLARSAVLPVPPSARAVPVTARVMNSAKIEVIFFMTFLRKIYFKLHR